MYMLWRSLLCLFKRSSCILSHGWKWLIHWLIMFDSLFHSVKESLRGTVKRQTERSNTLKRWMLTLTWLRLTWKRYVSSQHREEATNHTSLSYTLQCLTLLPGLPHHPTFAPSSFPRHFLFTFCSPLFALTPHATEPSKDWVTMCLLPVAVCKSWHCISSTVICC